MALAFIANLAQDKKPKVVMKKNKDLFKSRAKEFKKQNKLKVEEFILSYLKENPCVDCGENDIRCLEFDHVRGDKSKNISAMKSNNYSVEFIKSEIEKCDVRCANCHRRRTSDVQGWFKSFSL